MLEHNRRLISHETKISPKGAGLGALIGGPRTTEIKLLPPKIVKLVGSYGSLLLDGENINTNPICQKNNIKFKPD